jgi:hypothetical protein
MSAASADRSLETRSRTRVGIEDLTEEIVLCARSLVTGSGAREVPYVLDDDRRT